MIPTPFHRRSDPSPRRLLAIATVLAMVAMPMADANAPLCGLAIAAALAASIDGRPAAVLVAAGIAAGLGPVGLAAIPVAIGAAFRHRAAAPLPLAVGIGLVVWRATGQWPPTDAVPDLATLASALPALRALIAASGIGLGAWIAASAAVRRPAAPIDRATIALALFLPISLATLFPLLLLALGRSPLGCTPARAANDNPFFASAAAGHPCR